MRSDSVLIRQRPIHLTPYLTILLVIAGITLIMDLLRAKLDLPIVALIYLLTSVIGTTVWGLGPGLLAAVVSFFAFNYFFTPPIYEFVFQRTQSAAELAVFLIIALIIGRLARRAQTSLAELRIREQEAVYLYELSTALADARTEDMSAQLTAEYTQRVFKAEAVEIALQIPLSIQVERPLDSLPQRGPDQVAPITTAQGAFGNIRVWRAKRSFSISEQRLLRTFASQTALAVERATLVQSENRAKVLEESNQLKTALLSSVSHELRTPLATIRAAASSLQSGAVDSESASWPKLLKAIDEEAKHLNQLVGNLLDMSRIESGALNPNFQWSDLSEIIGNVLNRLLYSEPSHTIRVELPEDLPLLPVDHVQIEQVITNLLSNSLKYATLGTEIVVTAKVDAKDIYVQVTNESPPIPEDQLQRIFEKFYRITDSAHEQVTGTGLGLSICKGIIEAHNGHIWAENLPNHFAFTITLPLSRAELPLPSPALESETE